MSDAFPKSSHWVRVKMTLKALDNLPDPDVVVLNRRRHAGKDIPESKDAILVIEVADTTLLFDTTVKAGLYAAAGITDYCVLNIADRSILVHRDPTPSATGRFGAKFGTVRNIPPGTPVAPPSSFIDPVDLLPPL